MAAYALEGEKWGSGPFGTSGGIVTWAADSSLPASFIPVLQAAFADWEQYGNISFEQTSSSVGAGIVFSLKQVDGVNNQLGYTEYFWTVGTTTLTSANIVFDSDEGWSSMSGSIQSTGGAPLMSLALHEIGHAIGLDHYNVTPAIMNTVLNRSVTDLTASEIAGIQAIYGSPVAAPTLASLGTTTHSATSAGGEVYALYDGLLGRAPDLLGMEYWAARFDAGTSITTLADGLLSSVEGQARSGAADPTTFLTQLYETTLGRDPDAAGLAYWSGQMEAGQSRAQIGVAFSLSPEHINNIAPALDAGILVPDQDACNVARLYHTVLDRDPDAQGLDWWTNAIKAGADLGTVTASFLSAPEVQAKMGVLSDAAFIDAVYVNALGRHAETSGLQYWTDALASHNGSRVDVTTAIGESLEAQIHLAPLIEGTLQLT